MPEFKENEISIETIKKVLKALGEAHRQRVEERLDADDIPDDDWIQTIKEILDRGDAYPQILSFDEFDSIPWDFEEQFGLDDDCPIEEIEKEAIACAEIEGAKLYVQIDDPNGPDRVYHLGIPDRFHNKTGIYEVVKFDYWELPNP